MNILVTGGAGYIGSHLVRSLSISRQYEVTVVDDLSNGCYTDTLTDILQRKLIHFHKCDLFHKEHVKELFDRFRFDVVIHLAASVDVGESMEKPLLYYQNNVTSTLNLLAAMHCYKVKRIIFASSSSVYNSHQRTKTPIHEFEGRVWGSPYAYSKVIIEDILDNLVELDPDFQATTLRFFNVAGGDCRSQTHLIPKLLRAINNNEEFTIYGTNYGNPDGTCIRDYIHVDDVVRALHLALNQYQTIDAPVYNIGSGEGHSVREVINLATEITGREPRIIEGSHRPGDVSYLVANIEKAEEELGWKPEKTFREIIESNYENIKNR